MSIIKANNINIYHNFSGQGDALVIIGGFASTSKNFEEFIKPLKKHFKVLTFDNRGFGETEVTKPPYDIDMMTQDTIELMNLLDIKKAYILGHSMGSAITQNLCYKHSDRVKKAILVGCFIQLPFVSQLIFEVIKDLIAENVDDIIIRKIATTWIYSSNFLKNPNTLNRILDALKNIRIDPNGYEGQVSVLKTFDSSLWINKIETEILVLAGEEDIDTPLYLAKEVYQNLKNAKLKIIEKTAHMPFIEKPKEMQKILLDFFK